MAKGFDVAKPGTEELLPWNDAMQKIMPGHYQEYLQTIYFQRRDGRSLHTFIKNGADVVNMAGAFNQYEITRDSMGIATTGRFRPTIRNHAGAPSKILNFKKDSMELIVGRRDQIGDGMSILEAPWDVLFAIYMLISHSAYFVARAGAGLKDLAVDESVLEKDASLLATLQTSMTNFGSAHDTIIRPKTLGGQEVEFNIKTVDSAVDFDRLLMMYFKILSALTGIPQSTWVGLVPGQQQGAEVNEASYHDFLSDMQDALEEYTRWFVLQLNKKYKFNPGEEAYDILWRVRRVISDDQVAVLLGLKADAAAKLKAVGVKSLKALEMAGFDDLTDADLKEGVDDPIEFGDDPEASEEEPDEEEEE